MRRGITRRELIARGTAGAALGALGAEALVAGGAQGAPRSDAALVRSILSIELTAVFSYQHILAGGTLSGSSARLAHQILGYEQAHVRMLRTELEGLGHRPPPPPVTVGEADRQLAARQASSGLTGLRSELDSLRLLYDIEAIAIGAYYEALPKLTAPALSGTAAQIMAAEAQHAVAVGEQIHPGDVRRLVPYSFVAGKH